MQGAASSWARRGLDAYNALWTKGLVIFWMLSSRCKQQVVQLQHQRHELSRTSKRCSSACGTVW
eukprot:756419-Pleurochrysis_carterae.AAC.1